MTGTSAAAMFVMFATGVMVGVLAMLPLVIR
jgi:hypothetical protein